MWFGTNGGLDRYDGYNIKNYINNPNDTTSISSNSVKVLLKEANGDLLIGTTDGGLNRFHFEEDKFTCFKHNQNDKTSISNNRVNVLYRDFSGLVWVGTQNGLNLFDSDNGTFKAFKQNPDTPNGKNDQIIEIYSDNRESLWIGTNDGLFKFHIENNEFEAVDLIKPSISPGNRHKIINTIIEDCNHDLWVGTDLFIFRISDGKPQWVGRQSERSKYPTNSFINDIVEYSSEETTQLWMATHWGLNRYDYKTKQFTHIYSNPNNTESILNNDINSLFLDDIGLLWIAGNDGVDFLKLNHNPFNHYNKPFGKFRHSAITFFEDKEGFFWIGSPNAGLLKLDKELKIIKRYELNSQNSNSIKNYGVFEIFEDSKQFMWIGINHRFSGIYLFDKKKESFTKVVCDTSNNHQEPKSILSIVEDQNGIIWYATNSGLYWFNNNHNDSLFIRFSDNEVLSHAWINDLYIDHNNGLWVISAKGLYWLPEENRSSMNFIEFSPDINSDKSYKGTPHGVVQCNNGSFWLGTDKGLFTFNPGSKKFNEIEKENKLIGGNRFFSILEDHSGSLWLNSWKGLIRYNPNVREGESPKLFDISDGLPFESYNYTSCDPYLSNDGRIFVPGKGGRQDGFYCFHPDSIPINKQIPPLVITDLKVYNKPFISDSNITTVKHIQLKYDQNFLSFEFAALDYIDPGKNQYAYQFEGIDDNWIYCGSRRFASYTSIPPGNYVFRVKGSNNDGYWNDEGTSVAFTILPPPWKTWWAYLLYFLFIISILILVIQFYLRRQRLLHQLDIEHVEAEKLKELDTMKSHFFANVSHEFRTPLTLIMGPLGNLKKEVSSDKSKVDLNIIQRNALRLQQLINQLLNLSKLESGKMKLQAQRMNIIQLVSRYMQNFESLATQKSITLEFLADGEEIFVWVDRDKVEKILYNLLSNAFKYTPKGGTIEVSIRLPEDEDSNKKEILISVSDTGSGISGDCLPHIFDRFYQADISHKSDAEGSGIGLALAKELLELHHGKISVVSEAGKGSIFNIYLPIGDEHLLTDEKVVNVNNQEDSSQFNDIQIPFEELIPAGNNVVADEQAITDKSKPIVLIVEDNPDLRSYIREQLIEDYNIKEAHDGKQGFSKAIEYIPDLVLSDVMMPEMNGYELCAKMKKDERTSHIPLVILTARAEQKSKIEGLETGADDFITKPFDPEELKIRINNLIRQRKNLKEKFLLDLGIDVIQETTKSSEDDMISLDQKFLLRARNVVNEHLSDETFDMVAFSDEMNLSRTQLHRKLKALVDQPAREFIRTIRLNHASNLLKHKTGNISEIALEVGFSNPGYFAECFRKQFGKSPSEFVKTGEG